MSRSSAIPSDAVLVDDFQIERLALCYNKPREYIERALEFHRITYIPKFRTPDDGFNAFFSDLTAHFDMTPSMTKQEFADECDINVLMRRFQSTGDISVLNFTTRRPMSGDFTSAPESYHEALNFVTDTKNEFMKLNADIRSRFHNDPQEFLTFISDASNAEEMVRLGLAERVTVNAEPLGAHLGASEAPEGAGSGGASSKPSKKASKGGETGE